MKKYLHIGFNFKKGAPKAVELEPIFNEMAEDWIRYSNNCWIVWTPKTSQEWTTRLVSQIHTEDQLLILETNPNNLSQGWMPQWVWDWINKVRS